MKSKLKQIVSAILLITIIGSIAWIPTVNALEIVWPPAPGGKTLNDESNLVDFVDYAYRWGILLGGLAAFVALIIAGFQYLTSVGDPNKIKDARDRIVSALIGLALLFGSYIIITILNPDLTKLSLPTTKIGIPRRAAPYGKADLLQPCQQVFLFEKPGYKGAALTIPFTGPDGDFHDIGDCIKTSDLGGGVPWWAWLFPPAAVIWYILDWFFGWSNNPGERINSINIVGACQVNLYDTEDCGNSGGNFLVIPYSMSDLGWTNIGSGVVKSIKVIDISLPGPPKVETCIPGTTVSSGGCDNAPISCPNIDPVKQPDGTYKATLSGVIVDFKKTPSVQVYFEYGENDLLLDKTAPADPTDFETIYSLGTVCASFEADAEGLKPNTKYYWRAVAASQGLISFGATSTFITGP